MAKRPTAAGCHGAVRRPMPSTILPTLILGCRLPMPAICAANLHLAIHLQQLLSGARPCEALRSF
jgi:hypothetical protein